MQLFSETAWHPAVSALRAGGWARGVPMCRVRAAGRPWGRACKWVVLAEVLVGAVMYMMTKNVKFLAGFAIISVFIAVGMAVVGL